MLFHATGIQILLQKIDVKFHVSCFSLRIIFQLTLLAYNSVFNRNSYCKNIVFHSWGPFNCAYRITYGINWSNSTESFVELYSSAAHLLAVITRFVSSCVGEQWRKRTSDDRITLKHNVFARIERIALHSVLDRYWLYRQERQKSFGTNLQQRHWFENWMTASTLIII